MILKNKIERLPNYKSTVIKRVSIGETIDK